MPDLSIQQLLEKAKSAPRKLTVDEFEQVTRLKRAQGGRPPEERFRFSREELAEIYGVSPRTISRWVAKGDLPKPEGPSSKRFWQIADVVRHMQRRIDEKEIRRQMSTSAERYRAAKASIAELDLEELQGRLVRADEVERAWAQLVTQVKTLLLTTPDRLALLVPAEARAAHRANAAEIMDAILRTLQEGAKDD